MRASSAAALAALLSGAAALDTLPVHARGGKLWADMQARAAAAHAAAGFTPNTTAAYFDQLIFHDDPSKGTFKQKYYMDSSSWDGKGPLFVYISGEGPASSSPGGVLGAVFAKKYNGLLVTQEHRWYGESLPAPLTDAATLTTLSVDTEMADLAAFITFFRKSVGAQGVPVVMVGGSYAGALSAWFREKHPEIADMSWSSSGVVNAVYNFTSFDLQIVRDVPAECVDALRAVTAAAEAAWADPAARAAMLKLFGTPDYFTQQDFMWMLADSAAMGPQYGAKDALCAAIVPSTDPLTQFAAWTNTHYGPTFGASCYYSTACLSSPSMSDQWPNQLPWVYQCCSQLAYWQVHSSGAYRSSLIDLSYYDGQCQKAFGFKPNTTAFNERYGGARPNATRVVALQGSDDPWKWAGVQASLSPDYVEYLATCDGAWGGAGEGLALVLCGRREEAPCIAPFG